MRLAGMPLWTLILVMCAVIPFVIRAWIDAEQRRAKERTVAMLEELGADPLLTAPTSTASGPARAASISEDDLHDARRDASRTSDAHVAVAAVAADPKDETRSS